MFGLHAQVFFRDLARHLVQATAELNSHQYLLLTVVQRGNAVAVLGTMGRSADVEGDSLLLFALLLICLFVSVCLFVGLLSC